MTDDSVRLEALSEELPDESLVEHEPCAAIGGWYYKKVPTDRSRAEPCVTA